MKHPDGNLSFYLRAGKQNQKDLRFSKFKQRSDEFFTASKPKIPAIVGSRYGQRKRDEFISKGFVRCIKMNVIVNRIKYFLMVLHVHMVSHLPMLTLLICTAMYEAIQKIHLHKILHYLYANGSIPEWFMFAKQRENIMHNKNCVIQYFAPNTKIYYYSLLFKC